MVHMRIIFMKNLLFMEIEFHFQQVLLENHF